MVDQLNLESARVVSERPAQKIDKTQPVEAAKPAPALPEEGKKLPQEKEVTEATPQELDDAVQELNQHVQQIQRGLEFSVDEDSGRTVIKVLDMVTKEVIRQIPGDEALKFARMLNEGADLKLFTAVT